MRLLIEVDPLFGVFTLRAGADCTGLRARIRRIVRAKHGISPRERERTRNRPNRETAHDPCVELPGDALSTCSQAGGEVVERKNVVRTRMSVSDRDSRKKPITQSLSLLSPHSDRNHVWPSLLGRKKSHSSLRLDRTTKPRFPDEKNHSTVASPSPFDAVQRRASRSRSRGSVHFLASRV